MWRFRAKLAFLTRNGQDDFNTSNVEVPHNILSIILRVKANFNTSNVEVPRILFLFPQLYLNQFQYIKCGGSACNVSRPPLGEDYFNTSNVEVPPKAVVNPAAAYKYFNTSNVEVPQSHYLVSRFLKSYFNTSNVEVPPLLLLKYTFSILYFNTSNVEVPQSAQGNKFPCPRRFQYIKCGGSA